MRIVAVASVVAGLVFAPQAAPAADVVLKAKLTGMYLHTTSTGSSTATITVTATKVCWPKLYPNGAIGGVLQAA
jgi:hypothetical protein